jgi:hypothetical protein
MTKPTEAGLAAK